MGVWVHGCMGVWVHGCVGVWVHGCMGAWVWAGSAGVKSWSQTTVVIIRGGCMYSVFFSGIFRSFFIQHQAHVSGSYNENKY